MTDKVPIKTILEEAAIRPIHLQIIAACFVTAVVDGLDNQVVGFTAQAIRQDLHIKLAAFGTIFSAGTAGALVGAILLGRLADWIGRRRALLVSTLLFAMLTVATIGARTVGELAALRFAAGLGLGGAMPCFLTLVSEYAPRRRKALAMGLLWCGYPVGGVLGGLIGSQLVGRYGWQAMFLLGGGLAVLVAGVQLLLVPESLLFLVRKGGRSRQIRKVLARIGPAASFSDIDLDPDTPASAKTSFAEVFADGRLAATLLLWAPLFCTFGMTTFFVLWAPALLKSTGMSVPQAAVMVALNNLATLPSQATTGLLVDRMGPFKVLPVTYALLGVAIISLGLFAPTLGATAICMALGGFLLGPGIAGALYLATSIYPSSVRSSGAGLAMGVGRSGQVVVSLVIGAVLAHGAVPRTIIFGMIALPIVALSAILALGFVLDPRRSPRSSHAAADTASGALEVSR